MPHQAICGNKHSLQKTTKMNTFINFSHWLLQHTYGAMHTPMSHKKHLTAACNPTNNGDNNHFTTVSSPFHHPTMEEPQAKCQQDLNTAAEFLCIVKEVQNQTGQKICATGTEDYYFCG